MKRVSIAVLCCLSFVLIYFGVAMAAEMTAEEKAYRDKIEFFDVDFHKDPYNPNSQDVGLNFKMRNNGDQEVYDMTVRARFLDANGKVFTTKTIWPLSKIHNNMGAPFIPGQIWVGRVNPKTTSIINLRLIPQEAAKIQDYKLEIMELRLGETSPVTGSSISLPKDMTTEEAAYLDKIKLEDLSTKTQNLGNNMYELQVFCKIINAGNKDAKNIYARTHLYDAQGNLIYVNDSQLGSVKAGSIREYDDDLKPMFSIMHLPGNWDGKTVKVEVLSVKLK